MSKDKMTASEFQAAIKALVSDGKWAGLNAEVISALLRAEAEAVES